MRTIFELAIDNGPGIEEDRLDIEKDEDDPDQIKLNAEAFARVAGRRHAAFVRRCLTMSFTLCQEEGRADHAARDCRRRSAFGPEPGNKFLRN